MTEVGVDMLDIIFVIGAAALAGLMGGLLLARRPKTEPKVTFYGPGRIEAIGHKNGIVDSLGIGLPGGGALYVSTFEIGADFDEAFEFDGEVTVELRGYDLVKIRGEEE